MCCNPRPDICKVLATDPVSAIGLAASCASLLSNIVNIALAIEGLRERFKTAELSLWSLSTQLGSLEASTSELKLVLDSQAAIIDQRPNLLKALYGSLDSAARVISYILEELSKRKIIFILPPKTSSAVLPSRWSRTQYVFNESGLSHMSWALRDQVQAIHLLLSVAALYVSMSLDKLAPGYMGLTSSAGPLKVTKTISSTRRSAFAHSRVRVKRTALPPSSGSEAQSLELPSLATNPIHCPVWTWSSASIISSPDPNRIAQQSLRYGRASRALFGPHLIASVCAGLVTLDLESGMIWLVCTTVRQCLQEAFDDGAFYPNAKSRINTTLCAPSARLEPLQPTDKLEVYGER